MTPNFKSFLVFIVVVLCCITAFSAFATPLKLELEPHSAAIAASAVPYQPHAASEAVNTAQTEHRVYQAGVILLAGIVLVLGLFVYALLATVGAIYDCLFPPRR